MTTSSSITSSLCDDEKANACPIPFGSIWSPFRKEALPKVHDRHPQICATCGAFANKYIEIDTSNRACWACVFCQCVNHCYAAELQYANLDQTRGQFVELQEDEVCYQIKHTRASSRYITEREPAVVFVVDGTMPSSEIRNLKAAILREIKCLPESAIFGFISFTAVVSIYELGSYDQAVAEIFPGNRSPDETFLDALSQHEVALDPTSYSSYLSARKICIDSFCRLLDTIAQTSQNAKEKRRSIGVAIEYALALVESSKQGFGKILVFTSGPCTYGPGSVSSFFEDPRTTVIDDVDLEEAKAYYHYLGIAAVSKNTEINIFCVGYSSFGVRAMEHAIRSSAGFIVLEASFSDAKFHQNLKKCFARPRLQGIVEVRASRQLCLAHVIGPVVAHEDTEQFRQTRDALDYYREGCKGNVHQYRSGSVDESIYLCLYFDRRQRAKTDEYAYIQLVGVSSELDTDYINVATLQYNFTQSKVIMLNSIDPLASLVLIAKQAALKVQNESLSKATLSLDNVLPNVAQYFRDSCNSVIEYPAAQEFARIKQKKEPSGYAFPPQLAALPRQIYTLRRGPLLGPLLYNQDRQSALFSLFLPLGLDDSMLLVAPRLLEVYPDKDETVSFKELPLESSSMEANKILYLDQYSDIFLWRGADATAVEHDKAYAHSMDLANRMANQRDPVAVVHELKQSNTLSRLLECRLIPSQQEPATEQLQIFSRFAQLSISAYQSMRSKFYPSDDNGLTQYIWQTLKHK